MDVRIEPSWKEVLADEFEKPYFATLTQRVREAYRTTTVYPRGALIFNAFDLTPFDKVKVVILGQDPYHGERQAMGLSFSVPRGVELPPSLRNIYTELAADLGIVPPASGDLTPWASRGVFLLNATLTVRERQAGSHFGWGWETFTDSVIRKLSDRRACLVFILWGSRAQQKKSLIDPARHLIIEGVHPSPLSAYRGFFGGKYFSRANDYLIAHGLTPIDWTL